MLADILFTVIFTAVIQSMFGTGVLLFGTPLLLLYGYDFQFALTILLPTSVLINFLQLINKHEDIKIQFYKKLVLWSIPFIVLFLYFISFIPVNINLIIGGFLILIALKEISTIINSIIYTIMKYETFYLIIMGIIHGLTNLGGALLSGIVFSKNLSKEQTRATIAVCYLTFAIFQLITLGFIINKFQIFNINNSIYWLAGVIVFFVMEKFVYLKIDSRTYSKYFACFIFIVGILLIFKS